MATAAAAFAELPVAGSSGRRGRLPVMAAGGRGRRCGSPGIARAEPRGSSLSEVIVCQS